MPQSISSVDSEIGFILSTKGKNVLLYNGYRYVLNQATKSFKKIGDVKMAIIVEHMGIQYPVTFT
jgi:hypothetical protein